MSRPVASAAPCSSVCHTRAGDSHRFEEAVLGTIVTRGGAHPLTVYRLIPKSREGENIRLGIFAGLHGDEPASTAACLDFLHELTGQPALAEGYEVHCYPFCNPSGLALGTRHNHANLDLNREFWRGSEQAEVRLLEQELSRHQFHGIISLHADDTSEGLYGYSHGRLLNEVLLAPALKAGSRILPLDTRERIDGFPASLGMIRHCYSGVLSAPPEQHPQPFDLILESPARAPLSEQRTALVAMLHSVLQNYRPFLAFGQYL